MRKFNPDRYRALSREDRAHPYLSEKRDVDLCPACTESLAFWIRTGKTEGEL